MTQLTHPGFSKLFATCRTPVWTTPSPLQPSLSLSLTKLASLPVSSDCLVLLHEHEWWGVCLVEGHMQREDGMYVSWVENGWWFMYSTLVIGWQCWGTPQPACGTLQQWRTNSFVVLWFHSALTHSFPSPLFLLFCTPMCACNHRVWFPVSSILIVLVDC